jgi:hypothetical protein
MGVDDSGVCIERELELRPRISLGATHGLPAVEREFEDYNSN